MTSDDIADLLDGDTEGMQKCMELFGEHMGSSFNSEKEKKGKKQITKSVK